MYRLPGLTTFFLLFLIIHKSSCQESNYGKKVKCFTIQGSTVCPGCNVRAGLLCPVRPEGKLREFDSCQTANEEPTTVTNEPTATSIEETTVTLPYDYDKMETSFVNNSELMLYLYHYFGPIRRRLVYRSVSEEDSLETCRWNGDCPCPLICCKRGKGCPKKCVPGIRLPPHIYPGK